jgi:cell division protein FtsN
MKNLVKIVSNSLLLVILLSVIYLPIGMMSFINYKEKSVVLSAEDTRIPVQQPTDNDLPGGVPKEVRDIIMKLESGYQQSTSSTQPQE